MCHQKKHSVNINGNDTKRQCSKQKIFRSMEEMLAIPSPFLYYPSKLLLRHKSRVDDSLMLHNRYSTDQLSQLSFSIIVIEFNEFKIMMSVKEGPPTISDCHYVKKIIFSLDYCLLSTFSIFGAPLNTVCHLQILCHNFREHLAFYFIMTCLLNRNITINSIQ